MDRQVRTQKESKQGALTDWRAQTDKLEHRKNLSKLEAITFWRVQMDRQVMI